MIIGVAATIMILFCKIKRVVITVDTIVLSFE